jgi:hypothetical protein
MNYTAKPLKINVLLAAAAAVLALIALPDQGQASPGPFTAMAGQWSGGGIITLAGGARERVRCRANYVVGGSGSNLDLTLRCASDSFKFELQSNVAYRGGSVAGTWAELTRHVGGNISGSANGNHISVLVSGAISAQLGLATTANQQQISIQSPGSPMSSVAISLSRG